SARWTRLSLPAGGHGDDTSSDRPRAITGAAVCLHAEAVTRTAGAGVEPSASEDGLDTLDARLDSAKIGTTVKLGRNQLHCLALHRKGWEAPDSPLTILQRRAQIKSTS